MRLSFVRGSTKSDDAHRHRDDFVAQALLPVSGGIATQTPDKKLRDMHFYRRNLPHIENYNATYFVTFRVWNYPYLPSAARSIALKHCLFENGRKIELHACVIMPTHVHLLFTALEDERGEPFSLAGILKGIKGTSARHINKVLGRRGQLWQDESFDRIMRTGEFQNKLDYIVTNPIKAGLASVPGEYEWGWTQEPQARVPVPHGPE